jgi:hypothetical protein
MDPTIVINERVGVAVVFNAASAENNSCVPWKMKYKNQEIIFTKLAMRHPTAKGKRMIHVFDMSDGANDYRLEFDAEHLTWELINMVPGNV